MLTVSHSIRAAVWTRAAGMSEAPAGVQGQCWELRHTLLVPTKPLQTPGESGANPRIPGMACCWMHNWACSWETVVGHTSSGAVTVPLAMQGIHSPARDDAHAHAKGEPPEHLRKGSVAPSAFGGLAYCQTRSAVRSRDHTAGESRVDRTSEVYMNWSEVACRLVPPAEEVKMADRVGAVGVVVVGAADAVDV